MDKHWQRKTEINKTNCFEYKIYYNKINKSGLLESSQVKYYNRNVDNQVFKSIYGKRFSSLKVTLLSGNRFIYISIYDTEETNSVTEMRKK